MRSAFQSSLQHAPATAAVSCRLQVWRCQAASLQRKALHLPQRAQVFPAHTSRRLAMAPPQEDGRPPDTWVRFALLQIEGGGM